MLASFTSFLPSALQVSSPDHTNKQFRPDDDDKAQTDDDEPKHSDAMAVDEVGVKKKKDRTANETFIFVRPPPAKSNHPLNLQVQLVPPNSRAPGGVTGSANSRQSFDFNASVPSTPNSPDTGATPTFGEQQRVSQETTSGSTLSRTTSNRSEASMYSGYSSVASFSSVASSTASGRRMIIPLYNLQAHNVMTNVIVDAGTDAKVAKFMKRGMEMIDLAILEPIEVWGAGSGAIAPTGAGGARGSVDDGQGQTTLFRKSSQFLQPGGRPPSRPVTPDTPGSSRLSVSSSGFDPHLQHHPAIQIVDAPPPSSKRNIFGKLFKKKDAAPTTTTPTHSRTPSVPTTATISSTLEAAANTTPTPSRHARRQSTSTKAQLPPSPLPVDPETPTNSSILRPPVLGIQPTLSSPSYPPRGRPNMYVWIVRRWLKGGEGGILGGMMGKLGGVGAGVMSLGIGGNSGSAQNLGLIEVRFEWKRGKSGKKKAKGLAPKKAASTTGSANGSRRGSAIIASASNTSLNGKTGNGSPTAPQFQDRGRDKERNNRLSVISHHSISTTVTSEDNHDSPPSGSPARRARSRERERDRGEKDTDDGEESDPEDSETPWTCTLKVRRLPPPVTPRALSPRHASSFTGQQLGEEAPAPQIIRVKVGTLSPTPHHPKVVAMLKVPFPLPDIEVEQMSVRRRKVLGPNGVVISGGGGGESGGGGAGLELTAEEIKDVVCSTGMWLVVREGFGGVGKVSRKGDGWRIRA